MAQILALKIKAQIKFKLYNSGNPTTKKNIPITNRFKWNLVEVETLAIDFNGIVTSFLPSGKRLNKVFWSYPLKRLFVKAKSVVNHLNTH